MPLTAEEALGAQVAGAEAQHRQLVQPGHHLLREGQQPGQPLQLPVQPLPVPLRRVGGTAFGRAWPHPAGKAALSGAAPGRPRSLPGTLPLYPHSRPGHRLPPLATRVHGWVRDQQNPARPGARPSEPRAGKSPAAPCEPTGRAAGNGPAPGEEGLGRGV